MNINIVVKEIISQIFALDRKIENYECNCGGRSETCKTFIGVSKAMAVHAA